MVEEDGQGRASASDTGMPSGLLPALAACVVAGGLYLILLRTLQFGLDATAGGPKHLIDFNDFYAAGRMALQGAAASAYDFARLRVELLAETGREVFLPWAYPPAYTGIAALFAAIPAGWAYAGFMLASLALYLWVMRALAGRDFPLAILATAPVVPINIFTGQNGLLIAALAGIFAAAWRDGDERRSGLALGLMALKPHLALGLGVLALAGGRWRSLAIAAGVVLLSSALATLAFGPAVWPAFLAGARSVATYLAEGRFPLWRMLSLYAFLRTGLGLPEGLAMLGQGAAALAVTGLTAWAAHNLGRAEAAGLALLAALAMSPYAYDYDMALAGPAAALLIPALRARASAQLQLALAAAVWCCSLLGMFRLVGGPLAHAVVPEGLRYIAFGAPALLFAIAAVAVTLARQPKPRPSARRSALAGQLRARDVAATGLAVKLAAALIVAAVVLLVILRVAQFGAEGRGAPVAFIDFDAFYTVGRMVLSGAAARAYDAAALQAELGRQTGHAIFLPWAYPPPYGLLVGALALLPAGAAYALFLGSSLAAYLAVLRKLAGREGFAAAVVAIAPAIAVNVATGQNGLMTGALGGLFAALLLRQRAEAGIALGLLVLKPHLGVGLGLLALMQRRWQVLGRALATVAALAAASALLLGPAVWAAFPGAGRAMAENLVEGRFPLSRMISAYAALRTLYGASSEAALLGQAVGAATALAATAWAALRLPPREAVGFTLIATLAVSPYAYGYDLALAGPAAALLIPGLTARVGGALRAALLVLLWVSCLPGLRPRPEGNPPDGLAPGLTDPHYAAFAAQTYWILLLALLVILALPRRDAPAADRAPAGATAPAE